MKCRTLHSRSRKPWPSSAPPAARAEGVESANVVGYLTKTTAANTLDMQGVGFQNPGTNVISIQDIKPASGFGTEGGDSIRVWNPATQAYTYAFYFSEIYVGDDVVGSGWGDGDQNKLDLTLEPGQGFWLKTANAATFTIAGEVVKTNDNQMSTAANQLTMLGCVFPTDINIQDIKPVSGFGTEGGDSIRVWNPDTQAYTYAFYFSEIYVGDDVVGSGWGDGDQNKLDITIKAGQGFWLQTVNAAVLSFPAPSAL